MLMDTTGQSSSAAYQNIDRLVQVCALWEAGNINGQKVWVAPRVIAALDDFAARTGRRVHG